MRVKFLILYLLTAVTIQAADIFVYGLTGNVMYFHNGEWNKVYKSLALEETDSLKMDAYSAVTLLDDTNVPIPLQFSMTMSVKEAMKSGTPVSVKSNRFKEILNGIRRQIFVSKQVSMENYNVRQGATYRSSEEAENALAYAIYGNTKSGYNISFKLIDTETGIPVEKKVREEQILFVQVENHSELPLYVNLIDESADGLAPVLPIDSHGLMSHLLVPAYATVRFDSKMMQFMMVGKGHDTLILLADTEPFDLMGVIDTVQKGAGKSNRPIGVAKQTIEIL